MGWKTAVLAYAEGDPAQCLRAAGLLDPAATRDLVARLNPGWSGASAVGRALKDAVYPDEGIVYAGCFGGIDVVCDRAVMIDRPSELPDRFIAAGSGRTTVLHAMHSVSDFLAFAVWEDGKLVRSLSLSPDSGIAEDIGAPLPFEGPFWAGEHLVTPTTGGAPYPLPFHPLDLGEDVAMRGLLGFPLGGQRLPGEVDPWEIQLSGFEVPADNPVTPEQVQEFVRTHRRTAYRMGPGGRLIPVERKGDR